MYDATKADARGRWWFRVGTVNVGSMMKRSGEVSDMLCWRKVDVYGLQEVRFKNEGVKFLQGGQKMRYKMFWKGLTGRPEWSKNSDPGTMVQL